MWISHQTDRLVKLSVRKACNPLQFSYENSHLELSWYQKFNVCSFRIAKKCRFGYQQKVSSAFSKGDKT